MILVLEFLGALGILIPFALFQRGTWSPHSVAYLALNLAGSAILTVVAVVEDQYGFLIIQAAWTLVAAVGLARRLSSPARPPGPGSGA